MLRRSLIGLMLLVLCLWVPAGASAAAEDEGATAAFRLKGSNGYELLVIAGRQPAQRMGQVIVLAGSKRGLAIYATRARVEPGGVEADLGDLGRIDLEYVPLAGKGRVSCGRGGDVTRFPRGEYRGEFSFRGEEGYTEARATQLPADLGILLRLGCAGPVGFSEASGPGLPGARLRSVRQPDRNTAVSFELKKNRPSAPTHFEVRVRERRGAIQIQRSLEGDLGAGALRYDPRLTLATVAPPAPFNGSATFRRGAAMPRWRGNLTVDLPGRSDLRLAGPGFRTSLVHASWSKSARGRAISMLLGGSEQRR